MALNCKFIDCFVNESLSQDNNIVKSFLFRTGSKAQVCEENALAFWSYFWSTGAGIKLMLNVKRTTNVARNKVDTDGGWGEHAECGAGWSGGRHQVSLLHSSVDNHNLCHGYNVLFSCANWMLKN